MSSNDVKGRIRKFLEPRLGGREPLDSDDLFAQGFVNSLFAMQLAVFVQAEFGFELESGDLDFGNFRTIDGIAALVTRKTAGPVPAGGGDRG